MMKSEDGVGLATDEQISAEIASRLKEVESLLLKKLKAQALVVALKNPPSGSKSEIIKVILPFNYVYVSYVCLFSPFEIVSKNNCMQDMNASVIERVLLSLQDAEISEAIDLLDLDSCDILMKYVYKFMGKLQICVLMLKVHGQLCEKAGPGSIIRVLTDRKQV